MQLIVKEYDQPNPIEFNYEELKQELEEKVRHYETLVYTDDQIKEAKADRANLNKLKKALNDERLRREREYMEPFNAFKKKIGDIIAIIDKPVAVIDSQVKAYEEKCREEKRAEIEAHFNGLESRPEWLTLSMIWSEKWLNATPTLKAIGEEIDERLATISADLDTLMSLPEFSFEAVEVYKATLDINKAIQEGRRLADIQRRKEEQKKAQAEVEQTRPVEAEQCKPVEISPTSGSGGAVWIGFKAHLTTEQAVMLRDFFNRNGIQYQPIAIRAEEDGPC